MPVARWAVPALFAALAVALGADSVGFTSHSAITTCRLHRMAGMTKALQVLRAVIATRQSLPDDVIHVGGRREPTRLTDGSTSQHGRTQATPSRVISPGMCRGPSVMVSASGRPVHGWSSRHAIRLPRFRGLVQTRSSNKLEQGRAVYICSKINRSSPAFPVDKAGWWEYYICREQGTRKGDDR